MRLFGFDRTGEGPLFSIGVNTGLDTVKVDDFPGVEFPDQQGDFGLEFGDDTDRSVLGLL